MNEQCVTICWSEPMGMVKKRRKCPTCDKRTTFTIVRYEWYGASFTCLSCGDQWSDGERLGRPFATGWREKRIADAKRKWSEWIAGVRG